MSDKPVNNIDAWDECGMTPLLLAVFAGDKERVRELLELGADPLFHPLCGISPIYACGLAAIQGLRIQTSSAKFFANGANLEGVLTAPGAISDDTAKRLKGSWETKYAGADNVGKVAVLGDGLKFEV